MQLPPLQVTRAVIQRYARLLHRYQIDIGQRPLVLPNAEFFPDTFVGDEESVRALLYRMLDHSGMRDVPVDVRVVEVLGADVAAKCSTGGCGVPTSRSGFERLLDQGERWLIQVPTPELRHPVALTTNLARSLSFILLVETQQDGELLEPPVDVTADLLAVALGFGPLMLQGSYIYAKGCGGPQIARVTKLGVEELSIAVGLFAALNKYRLAPALKHLDATQQSLLREAEELFTANRSLVERLRQDPDGMSRVDFSMDEPGSFVTQLFGMWSKRRASVGPPVDAIRADMRLEEVEELLMDMPPASQAGRTSRPPPPPDPERDELKKLVADALNA